ncbi:MAG: ATP-binding protein [Isosphaeraceae bacterium]
MGTTFLTVRCVRCASTLKAGRDMIGRRIRCPKCRSEFPLSDPGETSTLSSDEFPVSNGSPRRDDTLSRSMLPGQSPSAAAPDEMVARLQPGTLRWLEASTSVEALLGLGADSLRARRFTEFLHPEDRALAEDEFRKAVERGERHDFVLRMPDGGGRMRYVRVYAQARYNRDGSIHHVRCHLKDVTERVQAEQELRRRTEQLTAANEQLRRNAEQLKEAQCRLVHTEKLASLGTLAAGMAHEINNPLAYAMNNVAVMAREVGDLFQLIALYEQAAEDLRRVRPDVAEAVEAHAARVDLGYVRENLPRMARATREGLQRVARIVENLRGFAQLDRSETAAIDVNAALDHSLAMIASALTERHIETDRRYGALPELECAAAPMNQVFLNLLMNALQAVEATGRGSGRIGVATMLEDGEIVVDVTDDGCGIAPEVLPRVFDPFFSTKPIGRGTGLGLSISHGIVAEHGGRIEVESTLGVGSRFRVRVPARRRL